MSDPVRLSLRQDAVSAAALLAAAMVVAFPAFQGDIPDLRDFVRWTLPGRSFWRAAIGSGELPQWNPYVGLGAPVLAAPTHATFYPGNLLLLLGPPATMLSLLFVLHLAAGGLGVCALARRLGCRPEVALVAGLTMTLGYPLWMWANGEKIVSGAWVPWAALAIARGVWDRTLRGLLPAAVTLALIALAGDPFLWLHAVVLGWAVAWTAPERPGGSGRALARLAGRTLLAGLFAALLAAPVLTPALALVGQTERADGLARAVSERWSLVPSRLLDLVLPDATGAAPAEWTRHLYGGVALLLAALAGRERRLWPLFGAAALGLLAALGQHTPVHALLWWALPPLRYMRYPEKHLLVCLTALALLAACGAERVLAAGVRARALLVPGGLLAAALLVAVAAAGAAPTASMIHAVVAAGALVAALLVARRFSRLAPLVAAVAALDLMVFALPRVPWVSAATLAAPPPAVAAIPRSQSTPPPRLYRSPAVEPRLENLPENLGLLWGVAHVPGHEPGQAGRQHMVWDALSRDGDRIVRLYGIEWLLLPPGPTPPGMRSAGAVGAAQLVAAPAVPRARLVGRVDVLDDAGGLALIGRRPEAVVVAPGQDARPLGGGGGGACETVSYEPRRMRIRCVVQGEALMVVREAWAPGWRATVDGQPAPIVRSELVLRGVYLPSGTHDVELTYRAPGLGAGVAIGGGAWLAALLLLLLKPRRHVPGSVPAAR